MPSSRDIYGDGEGTFAVIGVGMLIIIGLFLAVSFICQIIGVASTDRVVENPQFEVEELYTDQLASDVDCKKPEGQVGVVVKEYRVVSRFGHEVSRELISENVTREARTEVRIIGTSPRKHGYCKVEGYYRHRYAECYDDYSETSKRLAEERALLCNTSPYNEAGCTDVFYSSINSDTKSCSEIDVDELRRQRQER